jgi:serine/threonine protein kinase
MSTIKKDLLLCFLLEQYCKHNDYNFNILYNKLKQEKIIDISYTPEELIPLEFTPTKLDNNGELNTSNRLNNYNIIDNIGNGSFGSVFKCINNIDNQTYALKFIKLNSQNYNKIIREVQLMATFDHPNIIRYYYSWIDKSTEFINYLENDSESDSLNSYPKIIPYNYYLSIQMELCKESVSYYLEKYDYNLNQRIKYFKDIINGLHYLHDRHVIHRDLKPTNILIGLNGTIKISDFGMSIKQDYSKDVSIGSDLFGTFLYSSPESINDNLYSFSSDIYSLGIILFEMLNKFTTIMEKTISITNLRDKNEFNKELLENHSDKTTFILNLINKNSMVRPSIQNIIFSNISI